MPMTSFTLKLLWKCQNFFKTFLEAIDNTNEIVGKVDLLDLNRKILLPNFPISDTFKIHTKNEIYGKEELTADSLNQWEYLKHITYEGAQKRYGIITEMKFQGAN